MIYKIYNGIRRQDSKQVQNGIFRLDIGMESCVLGMPGPREHVNKLCSMAASAELGQESRQQTEMIALLSVSVYFMT